MSATHDRSSRALAHVAGGRRTLRTSADIEGVFGERCRGPAARPAFWLLPAISVIDNLLVLTLGVVGLHPFGARLDITGVRAKEHLRRLDLLGLLAPEIHLTGRDVGATTDNLGREGTQSPLP